MKMGAKSCCSLDGNVTKTSYRKDAQKYSVFIHLPVSGYLGCFQFWPVRDKAAMKICVQKKGIGLPWWHRG